MDKKLEKVLLNSSQFFSLTNQKIGRNLYLTFKRKQS